MSATLKIYRQTGASGSPTFTEVDGVNNRLNAADNPADGTTDPVSIPGSGTNYSFWASFRLCCTVAPSTQVTNMLFWTDGTNPLGAGVNWVISTCPATNASATANYTQATGTTGTTGNQLTTSSYPNLVGAPSSAFGYTSGSPLSIPGSFTTGTDTTGTPPTGYFGSWLVSQIAVGTTASPGAAPAAGYTIGWTEG
jgi:hypothetical protein